MVEKRVSIGSLVKQIHDGLEKHANNSLRSQDLTMAQVNVLLELHFSPEKQMTLKALERRLHVAQSTAAGIVARLEQKGLVEGLGDAADRRIKVIRITPAGEECCQRADRSMEEAEGRLVSGMTQTERMILVSLLERVVDNMK